MWKNEAPTQHLYDDETLPLYPILHIKHHMSILSIVSKTGVKKTKNICNVSSIIHNQGNCGP
jgi:hypothetical protein